MAGNLTVQRFETLSQIEGLRVASGFSAVVPTPEVLAMFGRSLAIGGTITVALLEGALIGYAADLPFAPVEWNGQADLAALGSDPGGTRARRGRSRGAVPQSRRRPPAHASLRRRRSPRPLHRHWRGAFLALGRRRRGQRSLGIPPPPLPAS